MIKTFFAWGVVVLYTGLTISELCNKNWQNALVAGCYTIANYAIFLM